MITSAYSKSSNSSGFNPILQKFYEMICEIIVSKTVCGIFLLFFVNRVLLIILWTGTIFRNRKITESKISRDPFISKKFPHIVFKIVSAQISWTDFFFEKQFFSRTWSFFQDWKTNNLGVTFFHKKLILYFSSKVIS